MFAFRAKPFLMLAVLAAGGCASHTAYRDSTVPAEAKAIEFLKREVPAWSRENGCFSCHNNGDAARALYTATRNGYDIPTKVLADTTAWLRQPQGWAENRGDPGFSDQRLANLQFAAALVAAFEAGHVKNRQRVHAAARMVARDQDADGTWPIEPHNIVGSPATYGTTLATCMALTTLKQAAAPETSHAIHKAEAWLRRVTPNNVLVAATLLLASTQDSAQRPDGPKPSMATLNPPPTPPRRGATSGSRYSVPLLGGVRGGSMRSGTIRTNLALKSSFPVEECLDLIRRAQTSDGGWGPYADSPPEPFDTAIVLLALAQRRDVPNIGEMIQRGRSFLAAQQKDDGSWPATTRPSRGTSYAQRVSTTGWATLALLATRNAFRAF